jgi:hypothetical protein
MNKPIYALSIKQPWAWLICKGYKDIENRNWKLPQKMIGERIYVHVGKMPDDQYSWTEAQRILKGSPNYTAEARSFLDQAMYYPYLLSYGAIIGEVTITGCVEKSESPWFIGKYGFVLANPVLYDKPIPCRGQLGFFKPEFILEASK